ncbi:hypothetical protein [Nocardioides houyundeii]|uniref:hypothetical protein n=1 Tax=Nocardioides houyundeii TaxID=2045452 RepID=UPI000DF385E1|nr:hypothetical protein [Nocardioides houyundeii]
MSTRLRVSVFVLLVAVVAAATAWYALAEHRSFEQTRGRDPQVAQVPGAQTISGPRVVFRHSGLDNRYGLVAMVPLADPTGPRAFTDVPCDRVAASESGASCLVVQPGVVTRFEAHELGPEWQVEQTYPLPGVPSRTRLSPDGALVATTSFVTGHSYMSVGFSTATVVRETGGGRSWGNLERFDLVLDGEQVEPVDRNVWGVTFRDDRRFYATVGTGGRAWLVEGDLETRTLTSVAADGECPSLSPDGSRLAFKVDVDPGEGRQWSLAVLDLATGRRTELGDGPRGVDDQVAWLDDETLLYGLPRADQPGVNDVWSIPVRPGAQPELFIQEAWSPTVVRPGSPS